MTVAEIPPSRIVLLGQSLGTAVTSGVAEFYINQGVEFAGIILVAGFSSLPSLLGEYRISGYVPVLSPLKVWPPLLRYFQSFIVDKWPSSERLATIVKGTKTRLRLSLVHARNDWDIPCHESDKLFQSAANATVAGGLDQHSFDAWKDVRTVKKGDAGFVTTWVAEPNIIIRQELFPYGGEMLTFLTIRAPADLNL
jgi:abhydrolase domain-containing protein 12